MVDDRFTHGSAAIIGEIGGPPRIELVRKDNRGASAARDSGAARVATGLVALLDADDD